jgi:hypothetical protein
MSQEDSYQPLLDPFILGSWLAQRRHIWQMDFLSPKELASFAKERGLSSYCKEHIIHLWKLGLLKADLIISDEPLNEEGIVLIRQEDEDKFLYADTRIPQLSQRPSDTVLEEAQILPPTLKLLFHPFRYTVLHHLEQLIPLFGPLEILLSQEYQVQKRIDVWLSSVIPSIQQYTQNTQKWNDMVALIVATEPCFYQTIFHSMKLRSPQLMMHLEPGSNPDTMFDTGYEAQYVEIDKHWDDLISHYHAIGVEHLKRLHNDLCAFSQMLDDNRDVHTILRLGKGSFRLKLKGQLGGAMLLQTMAEMVRRATERAFDVKFREEDECGLGDTPENIKEKVYGSNRFLDGDRYAANEFLRQKGLCYGPRVRWYVEGQTEYGGLEYFFKKIGATDIEILNLQGRIVQKKCIAFRESLRSDLRMGIFSLVSLDKDLDINERAVRAAAQKDEICGGFFISEPDFEFGNFDLHELQEIIWSIALQHGAEATKRSILVAATAKASSGKTFVAAVERLGTSDIPELWDVSKGKEWGQQLIHYAMQHPRKQNQEERGIVRTITLALRSRFFNYNYSRVHQRVNPETGRMIPRTSPMTPEERQREI